MERSWLFLLLISLFLVQAISFPSSIGREHKDRMRNRSVSALPSPIESHGKRAPNASLSTFLTTAAFIPVWATTVLPLTVIYQVGKGSLSKLLPTPPSPKLDSGYQVDAASLLPRSQRKYDIVILGATGFTGYLAVQYLAKTYGINKSVKWAIAGRSAEKLQGIKERLQAKLGMDTSQIDTIVVDTSVPSTMPQLVSQTRVVATTAGPYALYGNSVVEFCAKFGTHYVDITGEVGWAKAMLSQWQDTATETGARLIPFCGHDSIPWDLTAMKLQDLLISAGDEMKSVSFWDEGKGTAPGGTYATVLNFLANGDVKAPRADFDPFLRLADDTKSEFVCQNGLPSFIGKSQSPWDSAASTAWTNPFVMAGVNQQVFRWTHALRQRGSKSIVYSERFRTPNFRTAFVNYFGLIMFGSAMANPLTGYLLKRYAIPKPGEGPSEEDMEKKFFLCIKGEGVGAKGQRSEAVFYLDRDPGSLDTTRMLVEAGLCLAHQENELPIQRGGFMSPASGLGDLLLRRLVTTGTYFESCVVDTDGNVKLRSRL